MSDPEKKICRYFNTIGGCWYGDSCKFLHIPDKKPPCKFFGSSTGCRYGESCHFSHDRTPFKSVENYANPSVEYIKEVLKENLDPSELSGTNNNNMTQASGARVHDLSTEGGHILNNIPKDSAQSDGTDLPGDSTVLPCVSDAEVKQFPVHHSFNTAQESPVIPATSSFAFEGSGMSSEAKYFRETDPTILVPLTSSQTAVQEAVDSDLRSTQEITIQEAVVSPYGTKEEDGQNYGITPATGRLNCLSAEIEIFCGSCKKILERRGNESYCTLLKDHYLECFLDKEGDHVKYVKTKAALEPGQMYWCKSCILIFEKPWSLFQHMADKAKGSKVQRWEKKIHLDWMDSVAGLMAGYDLGLFSPAKLRIDLRNLLADQHTMEEEMEAAAVTAAAMMQWLAPLSSPWRLQQREMMRKIEQLNRQMLRKANLSLTGANPGSNNSLSIRSSLAASAPTATLSLAYTSTNKSTNGSIHHSQHSQRTSELACAGVQVDSSYDRSPTRGQSNEQDFKVAVPPRKPEASSLPATLEHADSVGPLGDGDSQTNPKSGGTQPTNETVDGTGGSGDISAPRSRSATPTLTHGTEFVDEDQTRSHHIVVDSNNTNSTANKFHGPKEVREDSAKRVDFKRPYSSAPIYGYPFSKGFGSAVAGTNTRGSSESAKCPINPRIARISGYGQNATGGFRNGLHRTTRFPTTPSVPPPRASNGFNPPSFHASMDFNCGFTDDEVEELLSQGIRPWDSEAAAALAVLRGEMDHLLD